MATLAHHLIIAGKLQHRGKLCGCDHVADALGAFRRPGVRVELLPWNADWRAEAAFIARHRPMLTTRRSFPIVCVHAYSHGFGWGAKRLAEELAAHRIGIWGLVGCDGVYRHDHFPLVNVWRCFIRSSRIVLPNVRREGVRLFYQTRSLTRGHRVFDERGEEFERELIETVRVNGGNPLTDWATHFNIDESPQWREACLALAEEVDESLNTDPHFRRAERDAYALRRRLRNQSA